MAVWLYYFGGTGLQWLRLDRMWRKSFTFFPTFGKRNLPATFKRSYWGIHSSGSLKEINSVLGRQCRKFMKLTVWCNGKAKGKLNRNIIFPLELVFAFKSIWVTWWQVKNIAEWIFSHFTNSPSTWRWKTFSLPQKFHTIYYMIWNCNSDNNVQD